nr:MAG TPA: hypothetical protein [Caudoviricetes sp.]
MNFSCSFSYYFNHNTLLINNKLKFQHLYF